MLVYCGHYEWSELIIEPRKMECSLWFSYIRVISGLSGRGIRQKEGRGEWRLVVVRQQQYR